MIAAVTMPKLGLTIVEGTLTHWYKQPGDPVQKGEPLLEITTDKTSSVVESPASGTLQAILAPECATTPVGAVLARVGDGEPAPKRAFTPASPYARALARSRGTDLPAVPGSGPRQMVVARDLPDKSEPGPTPIRATPVAERMAARTGLDLTAIPAEGRVRKADVAAVLKRQTEAGPSAAPRREALSPIRQAISRRMLASASTIPHVTLFTDAPVDRLLSLREELNASLDQSEELTLSVLLVAIVARALRESPYVNASLEESEIIYWDQINVGLAVALENGLIVPVIRRADRLSLSQIAAVRRDLVARARSGELGVDEVTDGTFTVTNLGHYGIDGFTPIINPPEAAILGVGRVVERPARQGGEWVDQRFISLSLSFDHRLMDGAQAARFLARITNLVERPVQLLL